MKKILAVQYSPIPTISMVSLPYLLPEKPAASIQDMVFPGNPNLLVNMYRRTLYTSPCKEGVLDVRPDGNCLFRALFSQLTGLILSGNLPDIPCDLYANLEDSFLEHLYKTLGEDNVPELLTEFFEYDIDDGLSKEEEKRQNSLKKQEKFREFTEEFAEITPAWFHDFQFLNPFNPACRLIYSHAQYQEMGAEALRKTAAMYLIEQADQIHSIHPPTLRQWIDNLKTATAAQLMEVIYGLDNSSEFYNKCKSLSDAIETYDTNLHTHSSDSSLPGKTYLKRQNQKRYLNGCRFAIALEPTPKKQQIPNDPDAFRGVLNHRLKRCVDELSALLTSKDIDADTAHMMSYAYAKHQHPDNLKKLEHMMICSMLESTTRSEHPYIELEKKVKSGQHPSSKQAMKPSMAKKIQSLYETLRNIRAFKMSPTLGFLSDENQPYEADKTRAHQENILRKLSKIIDTPGAYGGAEILLITSRVFKHTLFEFNTHSFENTAEKITPQFQHLGDGKTPNKKVRVNTMYFYRGKAIEADVAKTLTEPICSITTLANLPGSPPHVNPANYLTSRCITPNVDTIEETTLRPTTSSVTDTTTSPVTGSSTTNPSTGLSTTGPTKRKQPDPDSPTSKGNGKSQKNTTDSKDIPHSSSSSDSAPKSESHPVSSTSSSGATSPSQKQPSSAPKKRRRLSGTGKQDN